MDSSKPFAIFSDDQKPYEAHGALKWLQYVVRHYGVPDENIVHVGDETDQFHGGQWPKGADYDHTPNQEIKITREKIQEWGAAFPKMKLCTSNHGMRWLKKASAAELPSQLLRSYEEFWNTPPGWVYKDQWVFDTLKHPFRVKHGIDLGGKTPYRVAAEIGVMSCAFGHLHSSAGIAHVVTDEKKIWGMNVGCLIDVEAYAFRYGKDHKFKPTLGVGLVFDQGRTPFWLPFD